jgi:uncharacterized protein (TIGR03435 family)
VRTFANLAAFVALAVPVFAQAPPPARIAAAAPGNFEIADIEKSPPRIGSNYDNRTLPGGFIREGRYVVLGATVAELIAIAYGLKNFSYVGGGPSWLDWYRYDIVAKVPPGTTPETARLMLQNLLAERFMLAVHHGDTPVPAFLLIAANGKPNLKLSGDTDGSCEHQSSSDQGPVQTFVLDCHAASLSALAAAIDSDIGGGGYLSYPVVDATGLNGLYDLEVKWTPKWLLPQAGPAGLSIFQALEQQLGLKLDFKTTLRPGIVVDSVNEKPTPNSPQLAKIMPPLPPPQFDVATIRPTDPDQQRGRSRVFGDDIDLRGVTLKYLIALAWDLDPRDDTTLVAPGWLDSDRVDVHAKIADSDLAVSSTGKPGNLDIEDLRPMLRTLLIDRFEIKYHMEDRPASVFILTADHPKLTPADPSERTICRDGPGRDGVDPRMTNIMLNSLVTCQNMTMDQFAEYLTAPRRDRLSLLYGCECHGPQGRMGLHDELEFCRSHAGRRHGSKPGARIAGRFRGRRPQRRNLVL